MPRIVPCGRLDVLRRERVRRAYDCAVIDPDGARIFDNIRGGLQHGERIGAGVEDLGKGRFHTQFPIWGKRLTRTVLERCAGKCL